MGFERQSASVPVKHWEGALGQAGIPILPSGETYRNPEDFWRAQSQCQRPTSSLP
jgi:hypothetical protein